jgi:hypothetical protein
MQLTAPPVTQCRLYCDQALSPATGRTSQQNNRNEYVGFEVLTAVSTKMAVFSVVAPCNLVEVYQRFKDPCCLHHQGDSQGPLKCW